MADLLFPGNAPAARRDPKSEVETIAKQSKIPVNYMFALGEIAGAKSPEEIAALAPGEEYEIKPWLMVYVNGADCDASCEDRIHYLQQLHVALGKNIQRVRRYYLNTDMAPFSEETAAHFREEYPSMGLAYTDTQTLRENMLAAGVTLDPATQSYVLLIDPVGNVMMYYTEEHTPEDIMTDLETLLRYSSLG